ncbi:MAG TPA: hypothetical protein VN153_07620 [Tahibacter sp.]|nr:hypothetical protein [Tahibacter sp.]
MNEAELAEELAGLLRNHLSGGDASGPVPAMPEASAFGAFDQDDYKIIYFQLFVRMLNEFRPVPWDRLDVDLREQHGELFDERELKDVIPDLARHWAAWSFMWEHRALLPP